MNNADGVLLTIEQSIAHRRGRQLRLLLINPFNQLVAVTNVEQNAWNKYRLWKPLSLLVLAGLTPPDWEVTIVDENLGTPDYNSIPRPDLVGITAFTSQAHRAYEIAASFRSMGVPVVMGGIHASMCLAEASKRVDAVVTGEAENVWAQVLSDARAGELKSTYTGQWADMATVPHARHEMLAGKYFFGAVQITRGCPLDCTFCSVTAFSGKKSRHRSIEKAVEELRLVPEKYVLIVDDNLIGTNRAQAAHSKELFRAIADANLGKRWMGQVTVNFADDDEMLELAARSGCFGVLIGFESPTADGLDEIGKKFNIKKNRDLRDAVRKIQSHGIMVCGSFVLGLDVDGKGSGRRIAEAGLHYGVDLLNVLFLTPLPGTRLWDTMESDGRIIANNFPEDWKYYTLTYPVAAYKQLSWSEMLHEMSQSTNIFYSYARILRRSLRNLFRPRGLFSALIVLATNFSYKFNERLDKRAHKTIDLERGPALQEQSAPEIRRAVG